MPPTPLSRLPLSRHPAARPRVSRTGGKQSRAALNYEQGSLTDTELSSPHTMKEQLGEDSSWLITLSDLTLLLLCFFMIWHVVDKRQTTDRRPQTAGALAAVSRQPSAVRIRTSPTEPFPSVPLPELKEVVPALGPIFLIEPSVALAASSTSLLPEVTTAVADPAKENIPPVDRWDTLRDEMERYVADIGLGEGVGVVSTQHELLISLKDTIPFASGKADLREEIFPVLEKVAALVQNHPDLTLEVLGHTDDVPISTSEFPSNWELSAARASRVARYLVEKGVDPTRISTQGYAYFRPLLPNTSAENRATNRRVEIRLYRTMDRELSEASVSERSEQSLQGKQLSEASVSETKPSGSEP